MVRILFVVAGADKVAGVTLTQKLCYRAPGEDRAVVKMGRNQRQHLAAMRLIAVRSLNDHLLRSSVKSFGSTAGRQRCGCHLQKVPTTHRTSLARTPPRAPPWYSIRCL